jgi:hypothetical protein
LNQHQDGSEHLILTPEMALHRRRREPNLPGHPLHGQSLEPVACHHAQGGVDDLFLRDVGVEFGCTHLVIFVNACSQ